MKNIFKKYQNFLKDLFREEDLHEGSKVFLYSVFVIFKGIWWEWTQQNSNKNPAHFRYSVSLIVIQNFAFPFFHFSNTTD